MDFDSSPRLRRAVRGDLAAVQAFVRALSVESRARRFFSPVRELPRNLARALTEGDPKQHFVLIEAASTPGAPLLGFGQVALSALSPLDGEMAVVVADAWQRRGLGQRLLGRLHEDALALGLQRLEAEVLADNRPMLALMRGAGYRLMPHPEDPDLVLGRMSLPRRRALWSRLRPQGTWARGVAALGARPEGRAG